MIDRNVAAMNGKFWQRRSEAMRHTLTILTVCCCIGWANAAWPADYAAMSGEDLYRRFCASCHGVEGRGGGPVAASLRVEVPDLTLIARRGHGGELRDRIIRIIDGRYVIGAHGTRVMPVWGEDLTRLDIGNPDAERSTQVIIGRLADHVRSLQRPDPTDSGEQR